MDTMPLMRLIHNHREIQEKTHLGERADTEAMAGDQDPDLVHDLPGEEDQDLHHAQEGQGIDAQILAPENGAGDLALVLRTGMKERRTESADKKVFPA